jgi:pimeloyl-ACP methyl ester carboxylesterase
MAQPETNKPNGDKDTTWNTKSVKLPSGNCEYWLDGEGPLLVFCHGVSLFSIVWIQFAKAFVAAGYQVLAFDFFGHGYSDVITDAHYTISFFTDQLEQLLKALHFLDSPSKSITLIGHSMGGKL